MKISNITLTTALVAAMFATGCNYAEEDDIIESRRSTEALERQRIYDNQYAVWEFVQNTSATFYLWNEKVPTRELDYSQYPTPQDLFEQFRHEDDKYSFVTNQYSETKDEINSDYETDGIVCTVLRGGEPADDVIAVVEYVYDNSPAQKAGIKRGYVIHKVNGIQLNLNNYQQLLKNKTAMYSYSTLRTQMEEDGKLHFHYGEDIQTSESIIKTVMKIDPILMTSVIEKNGLKIGYFLYDAFTSDTEGLIEAIGALEAQHIDELVLDLRFNSGGYVNTADTLASMLVPEGNEGKVFIVQKHNNIMTSRLRNETNDKNFDKDLFSGGLPNLHLSRLFVLTSNRTASASEEIISGLRPYMQVITIGSTTVGKFTSNMLINNQMEGSDPDGIPYKQWAVYLCVAACTNSLGDSDIKGGIQPDYAITETYQYALGDEQEPLLAQALSLCTGSLSKSALPSPVPLEGYIGHSEKPSSKYGLISTKK